MKKKKKQKNSIFCSKNFASNYNSKRYLHRCTSNFVNLFFCWNIEILYQFCLLRNCTFLTRCTRMIRYKRFQFFCCCCCSSFEIPRIFTDFQSPAHLTVERFMFLVTIFYSSSLPVYRHLYEIMKKWV